MPPELQQLVHEEADVVVAYDLKHTREGYQVGVALHDLKDPSIILSVAATGSCKPKIHGK